MLELALAACLSVATPAPAGGDSVRLIERTALASARRYERLLRRTAPERFGSPYAGRCDEPIGRFCYYHGTRDRPRPAIRPEPPEVADARTVAVREHRRWFAASPDDSRAAGALVRYLIESGRAPEAIPAARAHAWAAGGSAASLMVLGLALHHAGDVRSAEAAFDSARSLMPAEDRRRLDDVGVLLDHAERRIYRRLSEPERAAYEARLWALSDPSLLEPGNERRSAHYARHALAPILAATPRVEGMVSWGRDLEELLIRYGTPVDRERIRQSPMRLEQATTMLERYHPRGVNFVPPALLTEGVPAPLPPGTRPDLERDTVRTRYAPIATPRTRGLAFQLSVFPTGDGGHIRIDAALPPDTVEPRVPARPAALLAVLDTLGREVTRTLATPRLRADSMATFSAEARVPAGAYIFRGELYDAETGLAGLAQHRVDVPAADGIAVSDLLVASPAGDAAPGSRSDPALRPTPALVVPPSQVLGVYAEVSGLGVAGAAAFELEAWLETADESSLVGRAARWLGERLGVVRRDPPIRVRWSDVSSRGEQVLFFDLDLAGAPEGLYRLGLTIRDPATREERTSTRLLRVDSAAPPL